MSRPQEAGGTRAHKALHQDQRVAWGHGPRPVRSFGSVFRGDLVDTKRIRSQPPLLETPDESCEVVRQLDVPEGEFLLGSDAIRDKAEGPYSARVALPITLSCPSPRTGRSEVNSRARPSRALYALTRSGDTVVVHVERPAIYPWRTLFAAFLR